MTITYERETATHLEHVQFLSWDHPLVEHAMDTVVSDVLGKSAIALCNDSEAPAGAYWLECLFVLSAKAPAGLELSRFLPPTPINLCIDAQLQEVDKSFFALQSVQQATARQLLNALQSKIEACIDAARQAAQTQAQQCKQQSIATMQSTLGSELSRLEQLKKVNPAIRQAELTHLQQQQQSLTTVIEAASLEMEAVRLVINHRQ